MIRELIYIVEILTVLKCIHCVYGEKQKINAGYVLTVVALFVTIEIANRYSIPLEGTFLMHSILAIYCILRFRRTAKVLIINTVLYLSVGTVIQLVFCAVINLLCLDSKLLQVLIADLFALGFCYIVLPKIYLYRLANWASKKNIILYCSMGYIFLIVLQILLNIKTSGGMRVGTYLTLIPFIICVYMLSKQWKEYQDSYEREKQELQLYREDKKKFDGIVSNVRSRQHEMNNHITAIMSLHYTADTYEELVNKQSEYCEHILSDNKFNTLLRLYNSVLPGFLVDKFSLIETKGINVECKILVEEYESCIPEYYLIEMLGILIDNAAEATIENGLEQNLYFAIQQIQSGYEYVVRNPYRYVPYEEIESWFSYEKSTKGTNRGVGLYHLKCLCEEWKCTISYQNIEIDNKNWIEFKVRTDRKK